MRNFNSCALCYDAPCNKACENFNVVEKIRSIRFDNEKYVVSQFSDNLPCINCDAPCKALCIYDIDIKKEFEKVYKNNVSFVSKNLANEVDISSDLCGIKLENPFLLSSSIVSNTYEKCAKAFDMGWAGVSFKTISLMNMQEASPRYSAVINNDDSFLGLKNIEELSEFSLSENLSAIKQLKDNYPSKVVIASIMGKNIKEWEFLSREVSKAGADAIELNFSCPNLEEKNAGMVVGQVPELVYKYTLAANKGTSVPILAKMTPNLSDICAPARVAIEAGASGISAINTIKSITNINIDNLSFSPSVNGYSSIGGYSGRAVKPISLHFVSEIRKDKFMEEIHISGIGGVYTWKDALEYIVLGAGSVQATTSIMEYGYSIVNDLISGLKFYMSQKNYQNLYQLISCANNSIVASDKLERNTILFPHWDYDKCSGCGRCYDYCSNVGYNAIFFDLNKRIPKLNGSSCMGCHMCKYLCPNQAISNVSKRINRHSK